MRRVPKSQRRDTNSAPLTLQGEQSCACGGGCPRCAENSSRRNALAESQPETLPAPDANQVAAAEHGVSGSGLPLPPGPRALLEAHLGTRLADVSLHIGPHAAEAAAHLGAAAYTLGRDIAFGHGFYAPDTGRGLRLLSHELTHVVQSRGAQQMPLQAGDTATAVAPLEREADRVSEALGRDRVVVRERLGQRMPLRHPVFISAHGDQGYLDAAAQFYASWGYSPIHKGVRSIEQMVKTLAGESSIGQVTIVSHANPKLIRMRFVEGGRDQVLKSDWDVDTAAKSTSLEWHLAPSSMIDTVIQNVQGKSPNPLTKIGPVTDPLVRQFIWWVVDEVFAEYGGYAVAAALRMKAVAEQHAMVYSNRLLSPPPQPTGAGSAQPTITANDLADAEKAVRMEAVRWGWSKNPPPALQGQASVERQLSESPSSEVVRLTDKPDFFADLSKVRSAITPGSWIEVQGCNAGADRDYLTGMQRFFGGSATPKVSAPDWYQGFGHYGWTSVPDTDKDARAQWAQKGVAEAFAYWFPIITGSKLPKVRTHTNLRDYLRQGHALPLARPGAIGTARVLLLAGKREEAFLVWLHDHQYRLAKVVDIRKAFFGRGSFANNVKNVPIDFLQEHFAGSTKTILRPSPEYQKHIISV
jgi:hypothetical protein